jgi:voltage-gated potassium channel Kch
MSILNKLIDLELKIKHYRLPFLILFFFWLMGFIFFAIIEPTMNFGEIFLLSITVRTSKKGGDFGGFYILVFPILIEVVIFGFIIGELLEKYNPVVTSRIFAKHQKNHTLIIGYNHLAMRIIDYCIEYHERFVIIEDDKELVEDIISGGYGVVIGDPTETTNLIYGNIERAKEVFICTDDVRTSLICTEKIRKFNRFCPIHVRAFEKHVQEYLQQPPLSAHAFSMSQIAIEKLDEIIESESGKAIVIGRDHLAHRIAYDISLQKGREVYLFDDEHFGIEFAMNENLHIHTKGTCFLTDLASDVNLEEVTQVFICWIRESEFDEAIYLTSKFYTKYPHIKVYVRVADDEVINLVEKYNATTFSSSLYTFQKLQKKVTPKSSILPRKK